MKKNVLELAKPYWVLFRVSDFTVSPVFLADDMTLGLQNIKCEIEDNSCLPLKEYIVNICKNLKGKMQRYCIPKDQ